MENQIDRLEELKEMAKDRPDILRWIEANILKLYSKVDIMNEKFFTVTHTDYIKNQLVTNTHEDIMEKAANFVSNGKKVEVEYYVIKR